MRVFRLCKGRYSAKLLSGEGGLEADGRWHTRGHRVIYCATSEALAVIEVRVHVGRFIPRVPFVMHEIELPDDTYELLPLKELPRRWDRVPHSKVTQMIGDTWLEKNRSLALQVPSIHSHTDWNILINPAHEDSHRVKIRARHPYNFDPRLFGRT